MIELLLNSGANLHAVDITLRTACMNAACGNHVDALKILRDRGADLQMRDERGETALYHAAASGFDVLFYLLTVSDVVHDLGRDSIVGQSVLSICFGRSWRTILFMINLAPSPDAYLPRASNILTAAVQNVGVTSSLLKKILRRVPWELLPTILRHRASYGGHHSMQHPRSLFQIGKRI